MADGNPTPSAGTPAPASVPASGTATPFELDPEQREASLRVSLADLSARATAHYAHKNYEDAAEVFAQAAEMQAEMNGEMSPKNAEILFLYGRALFRVGQSKSDVLGGKAPAGGAGGEGAPATARKKKSTKGKGAKAAGSTEKTADEGTESTAAAQPEAAAETERVAEEAVAAIANESSGAKADEPVENKPLFQFTGDENFEDSDEEEVRNVLNTRGPSVATNLGSNRLPRARLKMMTKRTMISRQPLRYWILPVFSS